MQGDRPNLENRELLRNSAHHPYRTVVNVLSEKSALSVGWDRSLQIICKYKIIISIHPFPAVIRFLHFIIKASKSFSSKIFNRPVHFFYFEDYVDTLEHTTSGFRTYI